MYDAGEFAPEPEIICPVCGYSYFISDGELSEDFGECKWVCYCCMLKRKEERKKIFQN